MAETSKKPRRVCLRCDGGVGPGATPASRWVVGGGRFVPGYLCADCLPRCYGSLIYRSRKERIATNG
jgi:hypothetical protein